MGCVGVESFKWISKMKKNASMDLNQLHHVNWMRTAFNASQETGQINPDQASMVIYFGVMKLGLF